VGQRFAVLATGNPEALIGRARSRAWLIALALVVLASSADAKPKRRDAKQAYDRGIAAYKKHNYEAASAQFGKSYDLEHDVETLFAWAQSERQLDHCDKAIELYDKLLAGSLTDVNRTAIEGNLTECRGLIAAKKPAVSPPAGEPRPASEPKPAAPEPRPAEPTPIAERPAIAPEPSGGASPPRAWYRDPLALGLLGGGVVVAGVGGGLVLSAQSLSNATPGTWDEAVDNNQKAKSRGYLGQAGLAVGGALLIGGVVRVVMHRGGEQRVVTGWLTLDGGGVAVAGAF
jgi:hypothetical protein